MSVLLTPSEIIAYLYCPRFIYFMFYLNLKEHEEKRFKVQKGRRIHEEKTRINKDYLRKRIGATNKETEVYLLSEKLHLRGVPDEVLTLEDGSMAPLDYKFDAYKQRNYKMLKTQSLAYALLISENYDTSVHKGFIVYTRSRNKLVEIEFTPGDDAALKKTIHAMLLIIQKGWYLGKTSSKAKCIDCAYKNICV